MAKRISIITITYNNFDELKKTLESIPVHPEIESIVINGGNCTESKHYLGNYHGVSLSEPDEGISDAFNKGVRLSSGDYLMFLNSGDVICDEDPIVKLLANKFKKDLALFPIWYEHPNRGRILIRPKPQKYWKKSVGMPCPHPGIIASKRLFNKKSNFDKTFSISMDFDWFYKHVILDQHVLFEIFDTPIVTMDGRGISSSNPTKGLAENSRILTRHGGNNVIRFKVRVFIFLLSMRKYLSNLSKKIQS